MGYSDVKVFCVQCIIYQHTVYQYSVLTDEDKCIFCASNVVEVVNFGVTFLYFCSVYWFIADRREQMQITLNAHFIGCRFY